MNHRNSKGRDGGEGYYSSSPPYLNFKQRRSVRDPPVDMGTVEWNVGETRGVESDAQTKGGKELSYILNTYIRHYIGIRSRLLIQSEAVKNFLLEEEEEESEVFRNLSSRVQTGQLQSGIAGREKWKWPTGVGTNFPFLEISSWDFHLVESKKEGEKEGRRREKLRADPRTRSIIQLLSLTFHSLTGKPNVVQKGIL